MTPHLQPRSTKNQRFEPTYWQNPPSLRILLPIHFDRGTPMDACWNTPFSTYSHSIRRRVWNEPLFLSPSCWEHLFKTGNQRPETGKKFFHATVFSDLRLSFVPRGTRKIGDRKVETVEIKRNPPIFRCRPRRWRYRSEFATAAVRLRSLSGLRSQISAYPRLSSFPSEFASQYPFLTFHVRVHPSPVSGLYFPAFQGFPVPQG